MRSRTPRGFTLLELGIVIGIGIFLTTAIAVSIKGMTQAARTQRTGDELSTLSRTAVVALKRGLTPNPATGGWQFRTTGTTNVPVSANAPVCYDLTRAPGASPVTCAVTTWRAAYVTPSAIPAGSPVLEALGGSTLTANGGYNPWCLPYDICLYPMRAEAVTCVPTDDLASSGLESTLQCGACNMKTANDEPTTCVLIASSPFSQALPAARMSYLPDEPGVGPAHIPNLGPYNSVPRTAF